MDLIGRTLGPFHIESKLGQGAMGTVFRAVHTKTAKPAAIKVITDQQSRDDAVLSARFEREIKLLSQFHHPNIVRLYGSSQQDGVRYYAMELVEGLTLSQILERRGTLPFSQASHYTMQICEALQEMHSVGVIHRDLKPGNLLVTSDHRVKLTDFGIAKDVTAVNTRELTRADHTVGTVAYMSPEQLSGGELTKKSDLYSLGIVLYRMLVGQLPFTGETMFDYMNQRMHGRFPVASSIKPDIPPIVDDLFRQLLAQDPNDRPRDAYMVMQKLIDIEQQTKAGTLAKTRTQPTRVDPADTQVATKNVATILKTVAQRTLVGARKRRFQGPWHESGWFLGFLALVLVVGVAYAFWPISAAAHHQQALALLEKPTKDYWRRAIDDHLTPAIQKDPDYANVHDLRGLIDRTEASIQKVTAKGIAKNASLLKRPRDNASEAERRYFDAMQLRDSMLDPVSAQERFRAIERLFKDDPNERGWALLAQEQLEKGMPIESPGERRARTRKVVSDNLQKAKAERDRSNFTEALQTFASIERLYAGNDDVEDLVQQARLEFLGPDDLFTKGKSLFEKGTPESQRQAFEWYFDPLAKKYPGHASLKEVEQIRNRWRQQLADASAQHAIESGLEGNLRPIEKAYALGTFIHDRLGDPKTAARLFGQVVEQAQPNVDDGFLLRAQQRLDGMKDLNPAEQNRLRDQARAKLADMLRPGADPAVTRLAKQVVSYYP